MVAKKSFFVFLALLATGSLVAACGDGDVSATPRSSGAEPVNWWQQVAEPDATNTGPNCSAAGCPSTPLTNIGSCPTVTADGTTIENFQCSGEVVVRADNLTLRNFRIVGGGRSGIRVEPGYTVTGGLFEYGEIVGGSDTSQCLQGTGFTGRYLHIHNCADTSKIGGPDMGPLLIEHSYFHDATGGHGDTVQVYGWGGTGSAATYRYNSLECGATTSCLITTETVGGVITFDRNWVHPNNSPIAFRCGWDSGDVGPTAIYVTDNLFNPDGARTLADSSDCVFAGNLWMDDFSPVPAP